MATSTITRYTQETAGSGIPYGFSNQSDTGGIIMAERIVPERITKVGTKVPAFKIDEKHADKVLQHSWNRSGGHRANYLMAHIRKRTDRKQIYLHQFVFELEHGYIPNQIDHINHDTMDNRAENLREVTDSQNQHNRKILKFNIEKPNGRQRYRARMRVDGKRLHVGMFDTFEEAEAACVEFKKRRVPPLSE